MLKYNFNLNLKLWLQTSASNFRIKHQLQTLALTERGSACNSLSILLPVFKIWVKIKVTGKSKKNLQNIIYSTHQKSNNRMNIR